MAHAKISVDVTEAQNMPGILAAIVASDLDGPTILSGGNPLFPEPMVNRPILATDTVRFVGECVAVIVSETAEQGADAAEAVFIDYEPLPVVVDMEEASKDEDLIYEEVGTNVVFDFSTNGMATGISDDSFFSSCDVVISGRVEHQRTSAAPLEVRSAAAAWDGNKLVFWISNQGPQGVKGLLNSFYGEQATEGIQVIIPDVGGGFGAKFRRTQKMCYFLGYLNMLEDPLDGLKLAQKTCWPWDQEERTLIVSLSAEAKTAICLTID